MEYITRIARESTYGLYCVNRAGASDCCRSCRFQDARGLLVKLFFSSGSDHRPAFWLRTLLYQRHDCMDPAVATFCTTYQEAMQLYSLTAPVEASLFVRGLACWR